MPRHNKPPVQRYGPLINQKVQNHYLKDIDKALQTVANHAPSGNLSSKERPNNSTLNNQHVTLEDHLNSQLKQPQLKTI